MDESSLRDTIAPKSDQLNFDDLLAGPIDATITAVRRGTAEQPVEIHVDGQRPFRPCKSMRRVLIAAWGEDGRAWVGRTMRLYGDPDVKYGGVAVGGIRISHLSHIDGPLRLAITATRGKRVPVTVEPLVGARPAMTREEKIAYLVSALRQLGKTDDDIREFLGHPADISTDEEIAELRQWVVALKQGRDDRGTGA